MIKAIIFDIGGTLVRTDNAIISSIEIALREEGIVLKDREIVINGPGRSNQVNVKNAVTSSYSGADLQKKVEDCFESCQIPPVSVRSLRSLTQTGGMNSFCE